MIKLTQKNGYSLVEVLVAVAILMLSIIGPLTIAAKSLQSAQYSRQQNTAFFLAQEGISAINTLRNNAALEHLADSNADEWEWASPTGPLESCFEATGCNLYYDTDTSLENTIADCSSETDCTLMLDENTPRRSVYQLIEGNPTPFRRIITLETVGADEVLLTSRVEWGSTLLGGDQVIGLSTSLFNLYK